MQLITVNGTIAATHDDKQEIDVDVMYRPAGSHSILYVPDGTKIEKDAIGDNPPEWKTIAELGLKQVDIDSHTKGIIEDKMIDLQRKIDACDNVVGVDLSVKKFELEMKQATLKMTLTATVTK